jgi:hypothetical protein
MTPLGWPALLALVSLMAVPVTARAQRADDATGPDRPFEISDNSFLIEEAFNQDSGIFQNIFTFVRAEGGRWDATFTQEWPLGGQQHQLSYTIPFAIVDGEHGLGDILINYRFQAASEGPGVPAFSPRLSLVLPTAGSEVLGAGVAGLQVNLPFSKQFGNVYLHGNVGLTWLPSAADQDASRVGLTSPFAGGSAIVRVKPMLNLMCEVIAVSTESLDVSPATVRDNAVTVSPGIRGGWNVGDHQIVVGAALPITFGGGATAVGVLGYFSYELPFRRTDSE